MATEHQSMPINGNSSSGSQESNTIPKDEVGWYFVEQYYTTLSRSPEKLHLFYSKRSQFVSGVEDEKVSVSVGQKAINERIKELDIQDCKVRVSNVDSQASFQNIVVQVIGEMSNKSAPHRKFVQTFVLAEQPNGYFVLNDIFRYINEEDDEVLEGEDTQGEAEDQSGGYQEGISANVGREQLTSSQDSSLVEKDAEQVDKQLEQEVLREESGSIEAPRITNGTPVPEGAEVLNAEEAPAAAVTLKDSKDVPTSQEAESAVAAESFEQEKPKDPEPTPAVGSPKAPPSQDAAPVAAPKPTGPKTWANLVASHNRVVIPPAPSSASPTSPAPQQSRSATLPTAPAQAPSLREGSPSSQNAAGSGWQTAGNDAKKQRPQATSGNTEKGTVLAYVKNVTEKVDAATLESALQQFGRLAYFDVSRQKNCAFVEFADSTGYNAAVAANPHQIGGEQIFVEERRPRASGYGTYGAGRGGMRGGRGGAEGRPANQGRGGFQKDGGRGGYVPRGRGGAATSRGRGNSQSS
ncbi:MAG: hypothetical protein M1819_003107 [Sarea resinae]|nr:MAG: hypothetical protein M1819_003107 [Sarea resinae]